MKKLAFLLLLVLLFPYTGMAGSRFPQPQFESQYSVPSHSYPSPPQESLEYLDVAVLFAALSLASYLVLKARSRRGIFLLTLFSLIYFGFWKKGCVCAVGSIQNVTMALFDHSYAVPSTILAFFLLPLLFTLLFGRTFCAAVCPLGAIQDIVAVKPAKVPSALENLLGIIPYVYLGVAVLFAATGTGFLICRLDPFVALFRLNGAALMLALGACFLLAGIIVARPYCRFFCPYGVLLNWMSRFSWKHATITPDECVQCKLCEDSCPFNAILGPIPEKEPESREIGIRRLGTLIAVLPLLVVLGGWAGTNLEIPLSSLDNTVQLAEQVQAENSGTAKDTTLASDAFRAAGESTDDLYAKAKTVRKRVRLGSMLLGGFLGLVIGFKLIGLSIRRSRKDYEPDRASCLSCARCFDYCPVKRRDEG